MRVIVIKDDDVKSLLMSLDLEYFEMLAKDNFNTTFFEQHQPAIKQLVNDIHRKFLYKVKSWLSDQGASV